MPNNDSNNNAIIAMILAIIALFTSIYAISQCMNINKNFNDKVSTGIDLYIKEKQDEAAAEQEKQAKLQSGETKVDVSVDDDAMKGDKNAPVTIVEFSDFQCPFCSKFYRETLPQITTNYIDKGKVKFVYRDFPIAGLHPKSMNVSIAAECVKKQSNDEKFFKFHNKAYENQSESGKDENLKKWAKDLGLNMDTFNKCYDNKETKAEVEKDMKDGQSYGVTGTPAFFVNGRFISGAQPYSAFETAIKTALTEK